MQDGTGARTCADADARLVESAKAGNRDAAATLIERYSAAVYATCLSVVGDPDTAQDIAQDVLLKAIQRLSSLRDPSMFCSWLLAVARNHCRDHNRTASHRQKLLREHMTHTPSASSVPGMGAVATDATLSVSIDLQSALDRLPEKYRLPLMLYYFDGLSSARVAEALGISQTGAGTRLCRARQALRELLEVRDA
jgi:RNA polymerase sigma-70 factor (ECF subfamily)